MASYTIKQLSKKYGLSTVYIRRSIRKGKLKSFKEQIAKNTFRHRVKEADYKAWRSGISKVRQRTDGRNRFKAYFTKAEYRQIRKLVEDNTNYEFSKLVTRKNPPKS